MQRKSTQNQSKRSQTQPNQPPTNSRPPQSQIRIFGKFDFFDVQNHLRGLLTHRPETYQFLGILTNFLKNLTFLILFSTPGGHIKRFENFWIFFSNQVRPQISCSFTWLCSNISVIKNAQRFYKFHTKFTQILPPKTTCSRDPQWNRLASLGGIIL